MQSQKKNTRVASCNTQRHASTTTFGDTCASGFIVLFAMRANTVKMFDYLGPPLGRMVAYFVLLLLLENAHMSFDQAATPIPTCVMHSEESRSAASYSAMHEVVEDGSAIASEPFYFVMRKYQLEVLLKTQRWRPDFTVTYAGYEGPWLEDAYFDYWMEHGPSLGSKRTYLPVLWTACYLNCTKAEKNALSEYVRTIDKKKTYYTVITLDKAFRHHAQTIAINHDLDILVFAAGSCAKGERVRNVVLPLLKDAPKMVTTEKTRKVSFVGRLDTHPVREELKALYGDKWDFLSNKENWAEIVQQSVFSLCPRGVGHTSYRLAEVIHSESIPIYVWDDQLLLPWLHTIPWHDMAIIIHRSEIHDLEKRVDEFDVEKAMVLLRKYKSWFDIDTNVRMIHKWAAAEHFPEDSCTND